MKSCDGGGTARDPADPDERAFAFISGVATADGLASGAGAREAGSRSVHRAWRQACPRPLLSLALRAGILLAVIRADAARGRRLRHKSVSARNGSVQGGFNFGKSNPMRRDGALYFSWAAGLGRRPGLASFFALSPRASTDRSPTHPRQALLVRENNFPFGFFVFVLFFFVFCFFSTSCLLLWGVEAQKAAAQ